MNADTYEHRHAATNTTVHANQVHNIYSPPYILHLIQCKCFQLQSHHTHIHTHTSLCDITLDENLYACFFSISFHFSKNVCTLSVCQPELIMLLWIYRNGFFRTTRSREQKMFTVHRADKFQYWTTIFTAEKWILIPNLQVNHLHR